MDILSKAHSIVSEYDQIMQQMMDNDIMLNQDKMTSLSRQKSALDESYQLCKQYIDLKNLYFSFSRGIFYTILAVQPVILFWIFLLSRSFAFSMARCVFPEPAPPINRFLRLNLELLFR